MSYLTALREAVANLGPVYQSAGEDTEVATADTLASNCTKVTADIACRAALVCASPDNAVDVRVTLAASDSAEVSHAAGLKGRLLDPTNTDGIVIPLGAAGNVNQLRLASTAVGAVLIHPLH